MIRQCLTFNIIQLSLLKGLSLFHTEVEFSKLHTAHNNNMNTSIIQTN